MASKQNSTEEEDIMTDADFERAMAQLQEEGNEEVNELLMAMSENRIISWDEAERILGETSNEPVKSSLPQQTRPTEPDNDTDVETCMQKLVQNDPKLVEINLNNMKRTPVPKIKRMIEAIRDNEHLEKLSLANMGLYDMDLQPLIEVLEQNTTLRCLNLETNYLSGDFFARLFKAALANQSLEEVKAVNQGVAFSTQTEREIIEAIMQNRGLTKVSINLRLSEGRYKVEQATIRNQEIRRILRRQMMAEQQQHKEPEPKPTKTPAKKEVLKAAEPAAEKKPPLKKQPSGAAAELAKQRTSSNLAIAGVNTPSPSTSTDERPKVPAAEKDKTAVQKRASEADENAKKPYEAEKSAVRMLLAEKAKQRSAAGRWPPSGEDGEKKADEVPPKEGKKPAAGKSSAAVTKASGVKEPGAEKAAAETEDKDKPKGPNWRDRLAKKEEEPPQQERKGSLALRDKFEQKGQEAEEKKKPKERPPPVKTGAGERTTAAVRGKFEQQNSTDQGEKAAAAVEAPKGKAKPKAKPISAALDLEENAAAGDVEEEEKPKKQRMPKKKADVDDAKVEEKDIVEPKSKKKPTEAKTEETANAKPAKPAGFTPSWRDRMNK